MSNYKETAVDWLFKGVFGALASNAPSRLIGRMADVRMPRPLLDMAIGAYCRAYGVAMDEVEVPPGGFKTFDDFFTRGLRPGARQVDLSYGVVVSPCDGRVQTVGFVERGLLLQAKGHKYELNELTGEPGACFEGGPFVTIYLSPRDYHRVHFPCDGELVRYHYVPGRLHTVAPRAARLVPRLFARNERISVLGNTDSGQMALVMVGATGVGRISLSCTELRSNTGHCAEVRDMNPPLRFARGEELGRFHLGSTVVVVFEKGEWSIKVQAGATVRMGQAILERKKTTS